MPSSTKKKIDTKHEHAHEHGHSHTHSHNHANDAHVGHKTCKHASVKGKILVLRPQSGISGDMLLTGLTRLTHTSNDELVEMVKALNLSVEDIKISVEAKSVNAIAGYKAEIDLPHEHEHRNLADIKKIIDTANMSEQAKKYAVCAFTLLAEAEAKVHNSSIDEVHFHEVGALDSIIDTCLCSMLFDKLSPDCFVCGPLPIADGAIQCAHGTIPAPAPAVLHLLQDMQIAASNGKGEMLTPTGVSLLKAFKANFGTWPHMLLKEHCIVYGSRIIPHIPNGAIFALGSAE